MRKLKETSLYLGDNGRLTCGRLHCAGMTAFSTGRDLSGQKMQLLTPLMAVELKKMSGLPAVCETCGQTASQIIIP
jgi:hypothetical protein